MGFGVLQVKILELGQRWPRKWGRGGRQDPWPCSPNWLGMPRCIATWTGASSWSARRHLITQLQSLGFEPVDSWEEERERRRGRGGEGEEERERKRGRGGEGEEEEGKEFVEEEEEEEEEEEGEDHGSDIQQGY